MKLSLDIIRQLSGWEINYSLINEKGNITSLPSRNVNRIGKEGQGVPVPPDGESAVWEGKDYEPFCETTDSSVIETLLRTVFYAIPKASDIKNLGNYLSAVLLGTHWTKICSLAAPNETIILELFIAPDDFEIHRLPWEMMYDGKTPLVALIERDVPIVRMIRSKGAARTVTLTLPLKVLFVIGQKLDNNLRPGAEYIGLLRQMKIKLDAGERNRHLNIKVLTEATWDELKESVEEFQPMVVHFISHGDESGHLLLSKRDDFTQELLDEPDYCDAAKLLLAMRSDSSSHQIPPIVVLNACYTSSVGIGNGDSYRSMAAQLVEGGVAVAVGMTGEVADGACRLFTRRFYQALITENASIDISVSTARGRRAAMLFYVKEDETLCENHIEWARPTLFLNDVVTFNLITDDIMCLRAEAPQRFITDGRIFCDRLSHLQHYQKFLDNSQSIDYGKMLLFNTNAPIDSKDKYGKTRLLRELAALTMTKGFIPCPIFSSTSFEPPPNLLLFAFELVKGMNFTREKLNIKKKEVPFVLELTADLFGKELLVSDEDVFKRQKIELDKLARKIVTSDVWNSSVPQLVRDSILNDFKDFRDDLAQVGLSAPIFVLLDDFHRYDGVTGDFLTESFFNEYGLGEINMPVCVIATYSTYGEQTNAQKDISGFIKNFNSRVYARRAIELKQIEEAEEARLAYTQHLLSLKSPLAPNTHKTKEADINNLFESIHGTIRGVPSSFDNTDLELLLKFASKQKYLLEANDQVIYDSFYKK